MRMRSIGGFVALALTLDLTGACGGGDDGGSETGDGGQAASDGGGSDGGGSGNEFCDQLDALPNNGFAFNFSEPETVQQQVEGLAAIEPPAEIADEYNRLIADYVQMVDPDAPDTGDIEEGDEDVVREYVMHTCPQLF
jgi:hypothetical protein